MVRIAVCDDENIQLEGLQQIVEETGKELFDELLVFPYQSVNALLKEELTFDLIMLDIRMDEMSGFDAAKRLREIRKDQPILFVTSDAGAVFDSFEFGPWDFIRKRNKEETKKDVRKTLRRFRKKYLKERIICMQTVDKEVRRINIEEILRFESKRNYLVCYLKSGESLTMRKTIARQEKELKGYGFTRINKGELVNLRYVDNIDRKERWVTGRKIGKIDLGRKYEPEAVNQYIKYLAGK